MERFWATSTIRSKPVNKEFNSEDFEKVIKELSASLSKDNKEGLGEESCNEIKRLATANREYLMLKISILNSTLSDLIADSMDFPENERSRKFKHLLCSNDITDFFDRYFSTFEGLFASHDKTRFVLNCMEKSLREDINVSLDRNYTGEETWNKKKSTGKCYWSPFTLKDTDTAWELYRAYLRVDIKKFAEICLINNKEQS